MRIAESGPADGPQVLLLHGGGVAAWMWLPIGEFLDLALRVLAPDLPGHDTGSREDYRSHEETVGLLIELIENRAPNGVHVAGFSLGAQLAVLLAATRPDLVRSVVVVSAQAKPLPMTTATLALLSLSAPLARQAWFARLQARELFLPESLIGSYLELSAHLSRATLMAAVGENLRFEIPAGWQEYAGPALVLVGGRERRLMRDSARAVHGARHGALLGSVLETVPDCGHGIPLQRPAWFAKRLSSWISAAASENDAPADPNVGGEV